MPAVRANIIDRGTTFTHSVVTTPICCPSRTSMWTSRYAHNLQDQTMGWCGTYPQTENETWVMDLKQAGYSTFLAGKVGEARGWTHGPPRASPHPLGRQGIP